MGAKCCSGRAKIEKRLGREIEYERYGEASAKFRRAVRKLIRSHVSASALSTQPFTADKCVGVIAAHQAEDDEFEALLARRDGKKRTMTSTSVEHNHHHHHRPSANGITDTKDKTVALRRRVESEVKDTILKKVEAPPPPELDPSKVVAAPDKPRPTLKANKAALEAAALVAAAHEAETAAAKDETNVETNVETHLETNVEVKDEIKTEVKDEIKDEIKVAEKTIPSPAEDTTPNESVGGTSHAQQVEERPLLAAPGEAEESF